MKSKDDPRHQSRIIALQRLFEQEFNANTPFNTEDLLSINEHEDESMHIDESFVNEIVDGVIQYKKQIDEKIRSYITKRPFDDTAKIDILILRISLYELLFSKQKTPKKVIIDEAVELAKDYGGDKSFTFINGVLGHVSADM